MSTIGIVGGTGFTGSHVAKEAARRGHQVVALSRSAPSDPVDGVRYLQGDAAADPDPDGQISAADVVVATLSPRGSTEGAVLPAYQRLSAAAAASGARLIVIGGFSSLRPEPGAPRFADSGNIPEEFAAEASEMDQVLTWLTDEAPADLDWLFVSPAGSYGAYADDNEPRGTYRTGSDVALFAEDGTSTISGADFALAILDTIEANDQHRTHVHFAY